ncbi:VPS10 domain-containing receptor SorCS1-like [Sardina pilchardus]|uniref:VPS10 domain-containing receptor SorCS1-like n=1 Tax=Sardina pilchardus TaxID=27697 RepID=UPI002E1639DC
MGAADSQLFLHVTTPVEQVILSTPRVLLLGQQTNLSALVLPETPKTAVYYWWIDNSTEPVVTLEGWLFIRFHQLGPAHVSLQVASEGVVRQDSSVIRVTEVFRSMLLAFSPNLEEHNPAIPEWREDLARVVMATISQVIDLSPDWLLVYVFPGPPTTAEVFLLSPIDTNSSQTHTHQSPPSDVNQELEKMSQVLANALNQNWVEFLLSPEVRITARLAHLGPASQEVRSGRLPGVSVLLLFLSVAVLGVLTFLMYRFKRHH